MYPYITENNLLCPQRYSYTSFDGVLFLRSYLATRMEFLCQYGQCAEILPVSASYPLHLMLKTFEVNKRIYAHYITCCSARTGEEILKPDKNSSFENMQAYYDFAIALIHAFRKTNRIIYLNTLLKLNDTLLSIPAMSNGGGGGGGLTIFEKKKGLL